MKRREFITLLGSAAAAWPLGARADQEMPVIGYLSGGSPDERADQLATFHQGLREVGYIEGHNVRVEYRWAGGRQERLPALAADLVSLRVHAIFATAGTASAIAAKAATRTIPIVFSSGGDPVRLGLVASLNKPGGNLTGTSNMSPLLEAKRLALFHEFVPQSKLTDVLINPNYHSAEFVRDEVAQAASTLGRPIRIVYIRSAGEIESAFAAAAPRADALFVTTDPLFLTERRQLITVAARNAMPAGYFFREFPMTGGLMSYGPDTKDGLRKAAVYVGRILKGEQPSELPVQLATKFELD